MNRERLLPIVSAAVLALCTTQLSACHSASHASSAAHDASHAECPVCKCEGDLACLDVKVGPKTPHCECGGETYYFCSDECRKSFEKHPERYVGK